MLKTATSNNNAHEAGANAVKYTKYIAHFNSSNQKSGNEFFEFTRSCIDATLQLPSPPPQKKREKKIEIRQVGRSWSLSYKTISSNPSAWKGHVQIVSLLSPTMCWCSIVFKRYTLPNGMSVGTSSNKFGSTLIFFFSRYVTTGKVL